MLNITIYIQSKKVKKKYFLLRSRSRSYRRRSRSRSYKRSRSPSPRRRSRSPGRRSHSDSRSPGHRRSYTHSRSSKSRSPMSDRKRHIGDRVNRLKVFSVFVKFVYNIPATVTTMEILISCYYLQLRSLIANFI